MDFRYNEEQQILGRTAREFLEKECPATLVRTLESDPLGYSPDLWRKMADLGWTGLALPEEQGGFGGDLLHLMAIYEEIGRALLPSPHLSSVVEAGQILAEAGSAEQKSKVLSGIISGDLILTVAQFEPSFEYQPRPQSTTAERQGDQYVINGTKLFVPFAHVADMYVVVAREGADGVTLLLVEKGTPGVTVTPMPTLAQDRQSEVSFENVRVPASAVIGQPGQGWATVEKMLNIATVLQCAHMVGGMQIVLEMTADYAKTRVQFGRPIGTFQGVSHKCSEMVLMTDGARFLTYQAGWMLSEGMDCANEIAMMKNWVSDNFAMACFESHQVHAGVGAMIDYDLQLYTRRGKIFEFRLGDADYHRNELGKRIAASALA